MRQAFLATRLAVLVAAIGVLSGCAVPAGIAGYRDQQSEALSGVLTAQIGQGFYSIRFELEDEGVRCEGTGTNSGNPKPGSVNAGQATITCSDGRVISFVNDQTHATGGRMEGTDNRGGSYFFIYSMNSSLINSKLSQYRSAAVANKAEQQSPTTISRPTKAPTRAPLNQTPEQQLVALKKFFEGDLIDRAEYEQRKKTILDNLIRSQPADSLALPSTIPQLDYGTYHALVIGIDNYTYLPKLVTAVNDAEAVAALLSENYDFKVTTLLNPSRTEVIDAFDDYRINLTRNENLLIYYAGHGWMDEAADQGYWLPVNAKRQRRSSWISNATLSDTLRAILAKHVMIVADSCYSGSINRSINLAFRSSDYLERVVKKKARVVLTSGGLEPVADGRGRHSPFATVFLDTLRENKGVLDSVKLFTLLKRPVMVKVDQTPEYSDVKNTGHDGGEFLFVRRR